LMLLDLAGSYHQDLDTLCRGDILRQMLPWSDMIIL
jgi:hypothetical protein